jgi:uncharacterized tellurite resistance protein B-like protein
MGSWPEMDAREERPTLTPALALLVAMAYMADVDGQVTAEEESGLTAMLERRGGLGGLDYETLIKQGSTYLRTTSIDRFLHEAPGILTEEQKLSILVNLVDISSADEVIEVGEDTLFDRFVLAFGLSTEAIQPYVHAILLKNNLKLFDE